MTFHNNCSWPGGKAEITCTEGRTLDIDYANRRYICRSGNYCPPNMGGVVFGCPALPPPVPDNSTGKFVAPTHTISNQFPQTRRNETFQRLIALTQPMTWEIVVATSNSSSTRIVTRPFTALLVPQRDRTAALSNVAMEK